MVEYLMVARSSATSSTTAACGWFSSRTVGATETGSNHGSRRHAREPLPLLDRDPELLERLEQLRVDLLQAVQLGALLGSRVVADGLIVDRAILHVRPMRLGAFQPVTVGLEPPVDHPGRLALLF